ncbi:hypothetical protein [Phenylobacterium sp.]|uniref:hypothetical protein n=1 Tax=Phenylobacterium sp. TaxID=1871053 RepID=UPI002F4178AE
MASSTDNRTLSQVTTDLARRWATQRFKAVQAYGQILADYGAGRSTGASAAGAYAKLAAEEGVRYSADAIGIASDFAAALVRKAGGTVENAVAGGATLQDLEMSGPLGGEASAQVLMRNPHDRPATLSFWPGNFTGTTGGAAATVTIDPPNLVLAPGDEQPITVRATLDPKVFAAGGRYAANVAISGFNDLVLRVRLSVLPS